LGTEIKLPARRSGKKILIVAGLLLALGLASLVGGAVLLYFNSTTDSQGYALSDPIPGSQTGLIHLDGCLQHSTGQMDCNFS
jgi:hypothetical protein